MAAANWWRDPDFQKHLLSFICRDRNFLKTCGGMLSPRDFRPARDESQERFVIATIALDFYKVYKQPIAGMLRPKVAEWMHTFSVEGADRKQLLKLVDTINSGEKLVAVAAMEDQVVKYLRNKKMRDSIETLVSKYEDGDLDNRTFVRVCKEVIEWSGDAKRVVVDILNEGSLDTRMKRRQLDRKRKRPLLLIDGFDSKTVGPGRGDLGLILALYKMGKSLCLAQLADSYAKQRHNVLYFTLEDPVEEVEDRMDAALVNLPINRLNDLPNKLRKRFRKFSKDIAGRIRVVDATSEGVSVAQIEEEWERQREQGFDADVVIIDYDDEIIPNNPKDDRRHQFGQIYRDLRQFLARRQLIGWTAAQTQRMDERTKIVTGSKASEDVGKIRKATVVIGIGQGEAHVDARYINVAAHKRGRAKFGFEIMTNPSKGLFYDRERSYKLLGSKSGATNS